jgi:hypothetical protein
MPQNRVGIFFDHMGRGTHMPIELAHIEAFLRTFTGKSDIVEEIAGMELDDDYDMEQPRERGKYMKQLVRSLF